MAKYGITGKPEPEDRNYAGMIAEYLVKEKGLRRSSLLWNNAEGLGMLREAVRKLNLEEEVEINDTSMSAVNGAIVNYCIENNLD